MANNPKSQNPNLPAAPAAPAAPYPLSFTAAGLRQADMLLLARSYQDCGDWQEVRRRAVEDNLLGFRRRKTALRVSGELVKRLQTLSQDELVFLVGSAEDDLHAMLWVSVCRCYPFLRELSEQLVAERWDAMKPTLPERALDAFMDEQKLQHEQLARTSPSTQKKLRSNALGMLRECRLRAADGSITPLYPSPEFVELVRSAHPEDLLLFPRVGVLL